MSKSWFQLNRELEEQTKELENMHEEVHELNNFLDQHKKENDEILDNFEALLKQRGII